MDVNTRNKMRRLLFCLLLALFVIQLSAKTYVVSVGIANYQHINKLCLPENDAKAVAKLFKTHTKNVITITGKYATKATILKALNDQFARAGVNDQVIFFFSGHGYDNGFCPYEMKRQQDGLTYAEISAAFRKCKAKRKIILADACRAGGMRKGKSNQVSKTSQDVMLFLACRTNENSIETPRMNNGFFTNYLVKALRGAADVNHDRKITAKELYNYVSNGVENLSAGQQHPVMWGKFRDNMTIIEW